MGKGRVGKLPLGQEESAIRQRCEEGRSAGMRAPKRGQPRGLGVCSIKH